jgi:hypothetical protein
MATDKSVATFFEVFGPVTTASTLQSFYDSPAFGRRDAFCLNASGGRQKKTVQLGAEVFSRHAEPTQFGG